MPIALTCRPPKPSKINPSYGLASVVNESIDMSYGIVGRVGPMSNVFDGSLAPPRAWAIFTGRIGDGAAQ